MRLPILDGSWSIIVKFWGSDPRTEVELPFIRCMFLYSIKPLEEVDAWIDCEVVIEELKAHNGSDGIGGKLSYARPPVMQKILENFEVSILRPTSNYSMYTAIQFSGGSWTLSLESTKYML